MSNYQQQQEENHDQQKTLPHLVANHPSPSEETPLTTDLVQKYLDENKKHILAILDKQALRLFDECAIHQEKLRDNLLFLATIADTVYPVAPIMQEGTASTMQPQHDDHGQPTPPAAATDTDTEDAAIDFRAEKNGNLAPQQSASTMQPQHHDHDQQLESILGKRKIGTPPADMQTARKNPTLLNDRSRTPTLLNHMSSTLHQHQQFLHEDSSNSGYTSIGTCSTPQLDMQATGSGMVNADSLNISSGNNAESPSLSSVNFLDLLSQTDLTHISSGQFNNAESPSLSSVNFLDLLSQTDLTHISSGQFNMGLNVNGSHLDHHADSTSLSSQNFLDLLSQTDLTHSSSGAFNMGLNVNMPHLDHHAAGANTTTDQGESEFAGLPDLDSEYASFLNFSR